ncbi:phage tail assembly chaperone [Pseudogemmobacter bohemicus]|uniref:phage tail assembly chaperone n=1 Tax=Pseudogemmobacter bohemicus TaxID=2250708 RepID=UPI001300AEBA|nr:hypothetical protein [Pseudogemmobacter bohemicus]
MKRLERIICEAMKGRPLGARVEVPEVARPLWRVFSTLSRTRTYSSLGPNALQFGEVEAYCRMMRLPLHPEHIEILMAMDRVWLDLAYTQQRQAADGVKTLPQRSDQPLTATLADLILG